MLLEYPIGQRPDLQIKTMELEDGQAKTCGELTTELFLVQTFMFEFSGLPSIPKTLPRRVRLSVERAAKFHFTTLDQEFDLDKLKKTGSPSSAKNTI